MGHQVHTLSVMIIFFSNREYDVPNKDLKARRELKNFFRAISNTISVPFFISERNDPPKRNLFRAEDKYPIARRD